MSFNAAEKHQSQVPALQLLVALGFTPLSQEETLRLRGGRLRNVVLDDILAEQLMRINRFTHRGREYGFDLEDAHEAMRRLKPTPARGRAGAVHLRQAPRLEISYEGEGDGMIRALRRTRRTFWACPRR